MCFPRLVCEAVSDAMVNELLRKFHFSGDCWDCVPGLTMAEFDPRPVQPLACRSAY